MGIKIIAKRRLNVARPFKAGNLGVLFYGRVATAEIFQSSLCDERICGARRPWLKSHG